MIIVVGISDPRFLSSPYIFKLLYSIRKLYLGPLIFLITTYTVTASTMGFSRTILSRCAAFD